MKAMLSAAVVWVGFGLGSAALAAPPSCDTVRAYLESGAGPEEAAKALDTTRARVNACAIIGGNQDGQSERRSELHEERSRRGLNH